MGYVPIVSPWSISLDAHIEHDERIVRRGYRSKLPWRRRASRRTLPHLIRLREHAIYGWHEIAHAGPCARGRCRIEPPPKPMPSGLTAEELRALAHAHDRLPTAPDPALIKYVERV